MVELLADKEQKISRPRQAYVGAPVPVAAYLSVVSKAAGFVGLALLLTVGFAPYADVWAPAVAVLAALTMTVGNLAALRQQNVNASIPGCWPHQ
jgi:NADH-quinone oxidoreductase subunit N